MGALAQLLYLHKDFRDTQSFPCLSFELPNNAERQAGKVNAEEAYPSPRASPGWGQHGGGWQYWGDITWVTVA